MHVLARSRYQLELKERLKERKASFGSKGLEKTGMMGIMADLPPNKGV